MVYGNSVDSWHKYTVYLYLTLSSGMPNALCRMSYVRPIRNRSRHLVRNQSAVYHVVNKCALGSMILDDSAKGQFVQMMWRQAAFCGVEVLAYCVMTNHFHVLVRVPEPYEISDRELMRRYRILYGKNRPFSAADPDVLEALLEQGGEEAAALRERLVARMHNLPSFISELKQRFSIWYNKNRRNSGTVWAERFRSIIIEDSPEFTAPVAAYIDLNPVRAEIVEDPGEYAFSSYGVSMQASDPASRDALVSLYQCSMGWKSAIRSYRVLLFGKGAQSKGHSNKDKGMIDSERARQVVESGGKLSWAEYLRMRVGYFTRGGALGSAEFVKLHSGNRPYSKLSHAHSFKGLDGEMRVQRRLSSGIG